MKPSIIWHTVGATVVLSTFALIVWAIITPDPRKVACEQAGKVYMDNICISQTEAFAFYTKFFLLVAANPR